MSKTSFTHLSAGRPSERKAQAIAALRDEEPKQTLRRVNFEVNETRHRKLKISAAAAGVSVKDFLTAYIDSLPDPQ